MLNIAKCYLWQGTLDHYILGTRIHLFCKDTNMFDRLLDAILVLPPWAALLPMTLHEDSIEELMQYMRAVHSDYMTFPAKLCSEDHGINAS